jgi:hypothetical protein
MDSFREDSKIFIYELSFKNRLTDGMTSNISIDETVYGLVKDEMLMDFGKTNGFVTHKELSGSTIQKLIDPDNYPKVDNKDVKILLMCTTYNVGEIFVRITRIDPTNKSIPDTKTVKLKSLRKGKFFNKVNFDTRFLSSVPRITRDTLDESLFSCDNLYQLSEVEFLVDQKVIQQPSPPHVKFWTSRNEQWTPKKLLVIWTINV